MQSIVKLVAIQKRIVLAEGLGELAQIFTAAFESWARISRSTPARAWRSAALRRDRRLAVDAIKISF